MKHLLAKLKIPHTLLITYLIVYFTCGIIMHNIGDYFQIARFAHWSQVITCYLCYMVPISILLREKSIVDQYVYGVVAIAFLEISGYALGTSYAFPNNFIDICFGVRNFTLSMTIFFGTYFPLGNWAVAKIEKKLCSKSVILETLEH